MSGPPSLPACASRVERPAGQKIIGVALSLAYLRVPQSQRAPTDRHNSIHDLSGPRLHANCSMRIRVERDRGVCVAQDSGDNDRRNAMSKHQGGSRVPEIMELYSLQTCLVQHPCKIPL